MVAGYIIGLVGGSSALVLSGLGYVAYRRNRVQEVAEKAFKGKSPQHYVSRGLKGHASIAEKYGLAGDVTEDPVKKASGKGWSRHLPVWLRSWL